MLTSSSFGDDSLLPHTLCKKYLTENIIDLVRAGVVEIFAFEYETNA